MEKILVNFLSFKGTLDKKTYRFSAAFLISIIALMLCIPAQEESSLSTIFGLILVSFIFPSYIIITIKRLRDAGISKPIIAIIFSSIMATAIFQMSTCIFILLALSLILSFTPSKT